MAAANFTNLLLEPYCEAPMATDAILGPSFKADPPLSGLWNTVPNPPAHLGRTARRVLRDQIDPRFRDLFNNRLVGIAITSPNKHRLKVNDRWCEMIGYSREELASISWTELTHPDDLASDVAQFQRILSGEIRDYTLEKRFLRKNGEILYCEISVTAVRTTIGGLSYAVGLAVDSTQSKRAEQSLAEMTGKLIEAQEQERARIGRELHDDIGQRLALLALDIDLLRQNPSRMSLRLRDLRTQIDEISVDIQSLSHDLHAAKLEYLGAVAGIKSWCMDFGQRFKIPISFNGNVRTKLPQSIGICLFRVVQEALHNVVKHSGAKRAEVTLKECPNEVHLVIKDGGRGFDEHEVRGGLGLISMRERIRLAGGAITLDSGPGCGTTIYVRVPLQMSRGPNGVARSARI